MGKFAVVGGGICGLAAALMLADDGHEVCVLERDGAPCPPDPDGAHHWERRGVGQFALGHFMQARGTSIMAARLPRVHELLTANGGHQMNLAKLFLSMQPGASIEPADSRFDQLTGRRSTVEWAFATAAEEHPGITLRRGVAVAGLLAGEPLHGAIPHVRGLRLGDGEELVADLVVDASGRRSPTPEWLAAVGASAPAEWAEESGFAYYTRYFRSADGQLPQMRGPLLSPYGSISILTLPADNGTWSVTLYGLSDDKLARRFRDPEVHSRVVGQFPVQAHWLDGEPITDVASMVGVVDRHRRFVVDGLPCATGIVSIGDASSCTNPSLGRGMSFGLMHTEMLTRAVAVNLDDPYELVLAFDEMTETEMLPWHHATIAVDRVRVAEMRAVVAGEPIATSSAMQMAPILAGAATRDPRCARAQAEIIGCLTRAPEVFGREGFAAHVMSFADKIPVGTLPGPDREQLVELVG